MFYEKPLNESIIYKPQHNLVILVFNDESLVHTSRMIGTMKVYYGAKQELIQAEVPLDIDLDLVIKHLPISREGVNTIYTLKNQKPKY